VYLLPTRIQRQLKADEVASSTISLYHWSGERECMPVIIHYLIEESRASQRRVPAFWALALFAVAARQLMPFAWVNISTVGGAIHVPIIWQNDAIKWRSYSVLGYDILRFLFAPEFTTHTLAGHVRAGIWFFVSIVVKTVIAIPSD
jgi:hypothetical protein